MTPPVVFLCGAGEVDKERRGYLRAFRQRTSVAFVSRDRGEQWIDEVRALRPLLALNPDARWWLPADIERLDAPTAVFHIDTFVATRRRVHAAPLYDHVFVFHPGFVEKFAHPGAVLLPHAADAAMLTDPARPRDYDVGWVGHHGRAIYRKRDLVLQALAGNFRMNDFRRSYSADEMAALYGNARIVVNVSRDDWPQDANMRCFEAMACGALLVTRIPTELTELGFREGIHFAGYRDDEDVTEVVTRYLDDEDTRLEIASRGHELVARAHTYDVRVQTILDSVQRGARAPAREWAAVRRWRRHFDVHVEQGEVGNSLRWFRRLRAASFSSALASAPRLLRLAAKVGRRWLRRRSVA